jgi:hypothetical protein
MKTFNKYIVLSAVVILMTGSIIGISQYQDSFSTALNKGQFLATVFFVVILYLVSLIIGTKKVYDKGWPLKTLIVFFVIQTPVIISESLIYEFNTGIAYNLIINEDFIVKHFWYFGSNGILYFDTGFSTNSYGINLFSFLIFIGLVFNYFHRPTCIPEKPHLYLVKS